MIRLRNINNIPPGEYYYEFKFHGKQHHIPFGEQSSPIIFEVSKQLSAFRKGNKLRRSDTPSCIEDIMVFTCKRLGNNGQWCVDTDALLETLVPQLKPAEKGCSTCGVKSE